MNASESVRRHPWVFALALALVVVSFADVVLAVRLYRAGNDQRPHRDRRRTFESLAAEYRALKSQSAVPGGTLPPGVHLTPDAVTAIAKERGIADRIRTTSTNAARQDERIQEQVISLVLTGVMREDLAQFLRAVEQIAPAVRTKTLVMTPSAIGAKGGATGLMDAHVEISAYETIPAQPK